MPIPKYNEMYRPFLAVLQDGNVHSLKEIKSKVIEEFKLTETDIAERFASGNQLVIDNRIGWCRTYLKKAELIESPARGQFKVTLAGKKLYDSGQNIDNEALRKYPAFLKFEQGSITGMKDASLEDKVETPQETLEHVCMELDNALGEELLAEILKMDPYKFEQLVVDLLIKMGYGKLQYNSIATKKSGDEGIDGIVTADKLGFDSIYIQAKRFSSGVVGRPDIQKFVGALAGQGAQKGLFITSSKFSKEAEQFVQKNLNFKIVLVNGTQLAQLMIDYGMGVSIESTYTVKRLDSDFFVE